ncbi:pyruvate dehydrogenase phosphatase regulatory subunit, mitochondrial-like [Ptychodera flava]|uniref:pyruvate dehydrogenase phosphatase regulatory subunit, mitochondrial-like n=1 Tax=Ptychodera flava TaxID=63121 RepID=UPI00396A184B
MILQSLRFVSPNLNSLWQVLHLSTKCDHRTLSQSCIASLGCARILTAGLQTRQSQPRRLRSSVAEDVSSQQLPRSARVVVVGAGISGCSVAYHLAQLGWNDVVVLEKGRVTGGSTWHAAGLLRRMRGTAIESECAKISCQLYASLEDITGMATGFKQCGALMTAQSRDRMLSYKKKVAHLRLAGMEAEILGPNEISQYHPLLHTEDLEGAVWIPADSSVNPSDVCQALSRAAIQKGVKIYEKVDVQKIFTASGRIYGVQTDQGYIKCEYLVNCGGMWARDIGLVSRPKVSLPLHPCEHYYLVTKPLVDVDTSNLPTLRDEDGHFYAREWSGGLMVGSFEPNAKPVFYDGIPETFEFGMLPEDWDHFQPMLDNMLKRIPSLGQAEVRQMFVGPESFTPDTSMLFGEVPEIKNYFVAAGYNSSGIALAGGTGQILADWIVNGQPAFDTSPVDIKRFCQTHNNKAFLRDRVREVVGDAYGIPHPYKQYSTARKLHCSPLYPKLEAAGAVFGERAGWERPLYVREEESDDFIEEDYMNHGLFGKPSWFEIVKNEYKACREDVGMLDMSSFAKFELKSKGNEATNLLQYLCCSDINMPIGNIVHTGMLNKTGGYENDCSVFRLGLNNYFIISPSFQRTRCHSWLKKHLPDSGAISLKDVTKEYTALNVMGPKAKELLQEFTTTPLDSAHFRPFTGKVIDIGYASDVRALAMTHCGEKGWVLYIPNEMALPLYDRLMERKQDFRIRDVGFYAYQFLRIEKFLTFLYQDFYTIHTPLEAGRPFQVRLEKEGDFLGRRVLAAQKKNGVKRRLAMFLLEDHDLDSHIWPWGNDPIYRNGQFTGMTTSTGYGFTLDKMVCIGWVSNVNPKTGQHNVVPNEYVTSGSYEIEIIGTRYPARARLYTPLIQ